jgi:hypothetical protein
MLMQAGLREFQIEEYLRQQRERGRLSPSYARSRCHVLLKFAADSGIIKTAGGDRAFAATLA